jgi:cell division protein FtsL
MASEGRRDNWLSHALQEAPWRRQTQATSVVALSVIVVLVIGALYLAQATSTATTGRDLQALEIRRQELEQQNAQIEVEIAALRSVSRLTERALELGFRPANADEIEYLPVEGLPRVSASQPETIQPELPVYDETLSGWLRTQWSKMVVEFSNFVQANEDA